MAVLANLHDGLDCLAIVSGRTMVLEVGGGFARFRGVNQATKFARAGGRNNTHNTGHPLTHSGG